jgi:hypothetical protein
LKQLGTTISCHESPPSLDTCQRPFSETIERVEEEVSEV